MTSKYLLILSYIFLHTNLKVAGQVENTGNDAWERYCIDSLTQIIDKSNPKTQRCNLVIDSIAGEKIISIKRQVYHGISKYTIKTNRTGTGMNIKVIDVYLQHDSLILATVYYADDKLDFWKKFYYKNNLLLGMTTTRGMRMSLDEKGEEYVNVAQKLVATKRIE